MLAGFWNEKLGVGRAGVGGDVSRHRDYHSLYAGRLGQIGRGFPAMTGNVAFLMEDAVLLAVSVYLFDQDHVQVASEDLLVQRSSVASFFRGHW